MGASHPARSEARYELTRCTRLVSPYAAGSRSANSADPSAYFDWWPVQGSKSEWIDVTFAKPASISETEIYWFDDTGRGGVRVPASWRLLYKNGDQWIPVQASQAFGVERNAWNVVRFTPVTTSGLRIEIVMQEKFSAGVQEIKIR